MKLIYVAAVLAAIASCPWSSGLVLRGQDPATDKNVPSVQPTPDPMKDYSSQPMRSTPHGICMYRLPSKYNTALLNSTFGQPEPQPIKIAPLDEPPLQGMYDTNQFALERIFYDRMDLAASEIRPARECVMFYVPYFVAWETSATNGVWQNANRPLLDNELLKHLVHYNSSGLPGRNHFVVIGRISYNANAFLNNGAFQQMVKLVLEDSYPGNYSNVFAVPYPTWFRYDPNLEATGGPSAAGIKIHSVSHKMKKSLAGCNPNWIGDLNQRMKTACNGRDYCSFQIAAEADTGNQELCPVQDVLGKYSCGAGDLMTFETVRGVSAVGHAVVLGCNRGPCWLWGSCIQNRPVIDGVSGLPVRSGPVAVFIGSARTTEYERSVIFKMCRDRPKQCSVFDTGPRENSSSFVRSRVPDMYQTLMAGTFCINPPGDTPTRKGLFDSLVVGCIPVVTSEDTLQHYRFHLPFWRSISVLITTEQLFAKGFNLIDYLADYEQTHAQELWQKQETLRKAAYSLQYSLRPATSVMRGPDAFDKILEHMLARPVSNKDQQDFPGLYHIVGATTGRKLFALHDKDWMEGFGVINHIETPMEKLWVIRGQGDGSCCYNIINLAGHRTLYAQANSPAMANVGASKDFSPTWADQRWRFAPQGGGTFSITNVASGRLLFAETGKNVSKVGATREQKGLIDQAWKMIPTR